MTFFTQLGIVLAGYTLYAALRGEVLAKSGIQWRTVSRTDSPKYFWVVIVIYAGLSIALVFIF